MVFTEKYDANRDLELIREALSGNRLSLEKLVRIHQDFIYNVSLRLFLDPQDALDATQEVLIKMITALKTFRGDSQFRTWLYRIAMNHFLNTPKQKYERLLESDPTHFSGFVSDGDDSSVSQEEVEEVRLLCSTAMLMCLNREQRLIFIVGEIFEADHQLGAELFGVSPANFRVKLHRAKSDLLHFVSGKCGIINPANPCRCPKKARVLIAKGVVDKKALKFNSNFTRKVHDQLASKRETISDRIQFELRALFQDSPFQVREELDKMMREIAG